jgi:hypothetical protein
MQYIGLQLLLVLNIFLLFGKNCLNKEVNHTELSPSIRIPCLNYISCCNYSIHSVHQSSAAFITENILLFYKTNYLKKEVSCIEPSPSVRITCLN